MLGMRAGDAVRFARVGHPMSLRFRIVAASLVLAAAGGGAFVALRTLVPEGRLVAGVKLDGVPVPAEIAADPAAVERWIAARADAVLDRTLAVEVAGEKRSLRLRDVVTPVDAGAMRAAMFAVGHHGDALERLSNAWAARRGLRGFVLPISLRAEPIEALAASLKTSVDRTSVDARLDLAGHRVVPDVEGRLLEADGAVVAIEEALGALARDGSGATSATLMLPTLTTAARVTAQSLSEIDISTVVGTFETHFGRGGDQAPRAVNIENAARKLDGLVLRPGQLVSFNQVVGERSEANGFRVAWEIFKGEMRPGVGGGTCQVASTFHAAAFFGGLEVTERLPHSRPSAYIPMGLDSTVVWPVVDLKMRNPHDFQVVVHTTVEENTLRVELLGKSKPVSVVFAREVVDTFPYERRIEEDPSVPEGKAIKKQGGIRGYRVRRVRTIKYASGSPSRTETSYDVYPATTEIYRVAPGTDPAALPALPDDVAEALAKKHGAAANDAVACAGDCNPYEERPSLEVKNAAGVHDNVGDQAAPGRSLSIAR